MNAKLDLRVLSYDELFTSPSQESTRLLTEALLTQGLVGIRGVPDYKEQVQTFVSAARAFSALDEKTKMKYAPQRDSGDAMGYELGAEQYKDESGVLQTDDQKASYYAEIPEVPNNKWPTEHDLKTPYLELAWTMFHTGKKVLNILGLNESLGIDLDKVYGWGRFLHYHKEGSLTNSNPLWCNEHCDHGILTGLIPSFYFQNGVECKEPEEAGLFVRPSNVETFAKVPNDDKTLMLFQMGEFGQLASNDGMKATKHKVQKALGSIERFTFALFINASNETCIRSRSSLTENERFRRSMSDDFTLRFGAWHEATLDYFRVS